MMSAPQETSPWDVAIVGAGAAGLLAAIFAAREGARVLLLETRPVPGAKIRVSGGGRCNILPMRVDLSDFYTSRSKNSLRNILFSWPLEEVREFFEKELAIPLKDEPPGQGLPREQSGQGWVDCASGGVCQGGRDPCGRRPCREH